MLPLPLLNILIVYVYREIVGPQSSLIEHHSRENINFQISFQLYIILAIVVVSVLGWGSHIFNVVLVHLPPLLSVVGIGIFFILFGVFLLVGFFVFVVLIIAIIAALSGKFFKFPLMIRFLK